MQQVNLYHPELRRKADPLSAVAMIEVSGLALLIFALLYGYELYELEALKAQSATRTASLNQMRATVAQLEAQQTAQGPDLVLDQEIQRATAELAQRKRLAELLSAGSFGNTAGFSRQFTALARQHVAGSWLTTITLGQGGESVNLQGLTLAPELVPMYLERLLGEQVFSGLSFNVMELNRTAQASNQLSFKIATGQGAP